MNDRQIKVLLIEDNPGDVRLIREMLKDVKDITVEIDCVDRLDTGLKRLSKGSFDAVLLDLGLPDSQGLDTFIKVHSENPDVAIVVMTGLEDEELAVKTVQKGAQDYLVKGQVDSKPLSRALRYAVERKRSLIRIGHLNTVLKTLRKVNQFVSEEKDVGPTLQGICNILFETRGYDHAWIALLKKNRKLVRAAEAGLGKDFLSMLGQLKSGELPECGKKALKQSEIVAIESSSSICTGCPLEKKIYAGSGAMTARLEHKGKIYGLMSVSIPRGLIGEVEEQSLFKEIAGDTAFALNLIEMEKERKQAEEQIKASLREKEVLLQEVHHRVKNNMQIISSLLRLQSRKIKGKRALQAFESSCNRVKSMVLIHERLYQSRDFARVDFAEYVHGLTNHLFSLYQMSPEAVKLDINIKNIFLDLNTAIPCGLIVNELVSNSLKHAFPDDRKGRIKIVMKSLKKNEIELTASDNGVGIPDEMDIRDIKSLGLHLVSILAEDQLRGNLKLDKTKGTRFEIKFKTK